MSRAPNLTAKADRTLRIALCAWPLVALATVGACTTFGSTTPTEDAAAPDDATAADGAPSDSSADSGDAREGAARPDATPDGATGSYVCGEPAVIGTYTVPSDCLRALGDAGCLVSSSPKTGDPCAPSSTQNGVISRCGCVSDRLERVTCTCQ